MTQANHDTPIRIEVPTIRPDDIMDAARPTDYDDITQLQYETLACLAENLTEGIEEVAGYTDSWTYAKDGEPGSYAITSIDDSGVWDKPLVEILRDDPAVGDWRDDELDNLAGLVRCAALRSTRTTCGTLENYDHYDIQGRVRRLDKQA